MKEKYVAAARRGIEAALVASVPQVLVPQLEEKLLRLPDGAANVGPRFVRRLGQRASRPLGERAEWLGASAFHFGYAAFWGAGYALAYQHRPMHPMVGGALLSALIYSITFTSWGGAVMTGTEPSPQRRTWKHTVLLASAPIIFGMGTALLFGRGPRRQAWGWSAL